MIILTENENDISFSCGRGLQYEKMVTRWAAHTTGWLDAVAKSDFFRLLQVTQ